MTHRKNTIVVDFSVLPKRPILEQVQEFVKDCIKIDMADVKSIQLHNLRNCLYIEVCNAGVAARIHKQHHLRHSYSYHGMTYTIPVFVDGPTATVKIHDLPPQMANTDISDHMKQYGKVLSIQNDVWKNFFPGLPNGVRLVRMILDKPVPSNIVINGQSSYVSYPKDHVKPQPKTSLPNEAEKTTRKQQQPQSQSTHNEEQINRTKNDFPSTASTDRSDDDDEDANNDDGSNDQRETETVTELAGKRRLSTGTSNGTNEETEENISKRPCSLVSQQPMKTQDSEWKVYHTRSKKKLDVK